METGSITEIGAIAFIFILFVREFFAYLKSKKQDPELSSAILAELQRMNNNHLHTIDETLRSGNDRLIDVIHGDNTRVIELLGEIKGMQK